MAPEEARCICEFCQKEFRRRKRTKPSRTCSTTCRIALMRKQALAPRELLRSLSWLLSRAMKTETCWNWMGAKDSSGYGRVAVHKNPYQTTGAHRLLWLRLRGEIPEGLQVLHKCDNPSCVNPDHLFLGTHEENMADMENKGRGKSGQTVLTDAQVIEIRKRANLGEKLIAIAANFNVHPTTIHSIVKFKHRHWVNGERAI